MRRPGLTAEQYRRDVVAASMPERDLLARVIEYATRRGWLVHHSRPARNSSSGWSTHLEGHPGCPDLILARGGVVMLVELKSTRGRLSPEQGEWLAAADGLVWRPLDWLNGTIEEALR